MELSEEKRRAFIRRLLLSRLRILTVNGFYGLLLMHIQFGLDEACPTAYTDGKHIRFSPDFLESLSDSELDFVMMHEIMHVALQHCLRTGDREPERFNVACDIVVNSNILLSNNMNLQSITLRGHGESMHRAPNGREGHEYSAEQVYDMLPANARPRKINGPGSHSGGKGGAGDGTGEGTGAGEGAGTGEGTGTGESTAATWQHGRAKQERGTAGGGTWDDHTQWGTQQEEDETLRDVWAKHVRDASEAVAIRDPSNSRGLLPAFAKRLLEELRRPQIDWRTVLNEFVQEEITDYSFSPPDRRFDDSPFFLPDYNEKEDTVHRILFMIDTSGSMSDEVITAAYSEIKGAIDQFNGRLRGWLGFFDAAIIRPQPFEDEESFRLIRPAGGGGTDFQIIFEYVVREMADDPPVSIIILTDGFAPFPAERLAQGIPVLWLLNNEQVTPPWGKIARLRL